MKRSSLEMKESIIQAKIGSRKIKGCATIKIDQKMK